MKKILMAVGVCLAAFSHSPAWAQEGALFSAFRIDASFPLQWATNVLLTPTNPKSDFSAAPSLKLSALGSIDPTLNYSIYVYSAPEGYWRVHLAEGAGQTAGARVQKIFGDFVVGGIYEHNWIIDGIYRRVVFQANDFSVFAGYAYGDVYRDGYSIEPSAKLTYRLADVMNQTQVILNVKSVFTWALDADRKWLFALTPSLRYYSYVDGLVEGKRNTRPNLLSELTYRIDDNVSLTGSMTYDRRWSNRIGLDYTNWLFLASVNFGKRYNLPSTSLGAR